MARYVGVDASGVGLQKGVCYVGLNGQRSLGGASEPEGPQLHIALQGGLAQKLRQGAARQAAGEIHLEQPVFRMAPALKENHIVFVARHDVGQAVLVAQDGGAGLQVGKGQRRLCRGPIAKQEGCQNQQHGRALRHDVPPTRIF